MTLRHINLARKLINNSDHHQHKHSCLIFKKNRLISYGWNQLKTDPKSNHPYKSVHAEHHASCGLTPEELKDATVFIYREHRDGTLANSRPCPSCLSMLQCLNIKKIIYSTDDGLKEEVF